MQASLALGCLPKTDYFFLHAMCFHCCFLFQGVWIRQGSVGFISAVAGKLNVVDVHCNLLPSLQPFLKQKILQIDKEVYLKPLILSLPLIQEGQLSVSGERMRTSTG